MGFVVFFLLAWLVIFLFAGMKKKLTFVENTLVFLIILIVSINYSWIVIEELKLIKLSHHYLNYTGYLLNRSVIIPMVTLIQLNLLCRCKTRWMKLTVMITAVIFMMGVSFLSNFYSITEFQRWHYWMDGIYYFILYLIAFLSFRFFAKVTRNVVSYS
ncbi:hypothetical protein QFZ87_004739 [Bacillus sp. SLBN-46]|uniref:hypothetical protein n=1 Tax=Bacillus sp. SLBN-46 TaxID=3042283 RepID=UPI0028550631|nr:hypothetical protein [Bacillus sp. SLBN-46]MDR6125142.1 hypothetical protein [Bacillus sp. SLBN-46]